MVRPSYRKLRHPNERLGAINLILLLLASAALADPPRPHESVLLLQPAAASPATRQSIARIRDELAADRFRVVLVDSASTRKPGAIVDGAAHGFGADTILTLFGDPGEGQAELWLIERARGRAVIRRVMVIAEPERMPEVLSTRALELLRATALEISIEATMAPPPQQAPDTVAASQPGPVPLPPPPSDRGILTLHGGMAMLRSLDGPPAAVAPMGRIQLRLSNWLTARLTLAGLGSRPRIETAYGSVELSQTIGLVETGAVFRNGKRLQPTVGVGAGVLKVSMVGVGKPPYEGRDEHQWSAVLDASIGGTLALRSWVALVTELHVFLASPHPEVRFLKMRTATIGYPSFLALLALQVDL